jgi:hypothetical protein
MSNEEKKPKAGERLSAIERMLVPAVQRIGELEMLAFQLSRENDVLKDALQLLHEKQESIISLINEGTPLTNENINNKATRLRELELEQKTKQLVDDGHVESAEEITDNSFVVARELNKDGTVENPRIQFMTARLVPEIQEKFIGKKVGELVEGEDDKLDMEVMEIYSFIEKQLIPEGELESDEVDAEESGESKEA